MTQDTRGYAFDTLAVHAGYEPDAVHGAVMPPVVMASTFAQPEPGKPLKYDYSRSGNPTRSALESALAALEGGARGFAFSSGCAAATTPRSPNPRHRARRAPSETKIEAARDVRRTRAVSNPQCRQPWFHRPKSSRARCVPRDTSRADRATRTKADKR